MRWFCSFLLTQVQVVTVVQKADAFDATADGCQLPPPEILHAQLQTMMVRQAALARMSFVLFHQLVCRRASQLPLG